MSHVAKLHCPACYDAGRLGDLLLVPLVADATTVRCRTCESWWESICERNAEMHVLRLISDAAVDALQADMQAVAFVDALREASAAGNPFLFREVLRRFDAMPAAQFTPAWDSVLR